MNKQLYRISVFLVFLVINCNNDRVFINSFNEDQTITILTQDTIRYVINGEHKSIPDTNYIKYKISSRRFADEFGVCWDKDGYKWKVVNEALEIVDNRLNSNLYFLKINHDLDSRNIPTMINYMENDCIRFTIEDNIGVRLGILKSYHVVAENGKYIN
ncbi:hypothetical protein A8B79_08895 [Balneola sp. EhC07]|uniref:hypothetical protein n=1 Tax=Balneola sp. EhC07 TaxID=1849360 RepID=UPI0007F4D89F|nr:hypothetical protein [Balneola sp. EhC07]OAN60631.1 hypothetical protein A8B79_08895 [Balneola sp. EhC07]